MTGKPSILTLMRDHDNVSRAPRRHGTYIDTCCDDKCDYDNFMRSIGMKCGYEYSSLCSCDNYHDWLHYHCNKRYQSCIIESISTSKLIDTQWKTILKAPETQLAGIMLYLHTIPTVYYLKCDKCVVESKQIRWGGWHLDYYYRCGHDKAKMKCSKFLDKDDVDVQNININCNTDWFRYDDEIEYSKMIKQQVRYRYLFDTMFLFTLLYYAPMVKHLLILKTPTWKSDICIFSDSIWKKWNYYKRKTHMFQRRTHENCHLRNTSATKNLKIEFVDNDWDTEICKSNIILTKQTDNDAQINLKVCNKWN